MFYVEENGDIVGTQYTLVITKASNVWVTVSPTPYQSTAELSTPLDLTLLVLRSKPDRNGNSLLTFTEKRDNMGVSLNGCFNWVCCIA